MMNWLYYLLEANLYLAAFYGFYRLLLHKETFYSLNRYYLIITSIIAFIIPLLQVGYLNNLLNNQKEVTILSVQLTPVIEKSNAFTISNLLIYCYLFIALFFAIKMAMSIYKILLLSINAKKQKSGKITYVELGESHAAFSFFNLLFLNPSVQEKNTILKHEMVHIKQKHSLDIIFFEIIQIVSWFNPITYFIKKEIKLLHEYIADDITTHKDIQKHQYAMFLIQNSFGIAPNQLTNQIFNQSILKRRINMLNKKNQREERGSNSCLHCQLPEGCSAHPPWRLLKTMQ
ncbi:M56 family metallopeptidase [Pedobacter panaciterrae]